MVCLGRLGHVRRVGLRVARPRRTTGQSRAQLLQRAVDGLAQARCGLARGRGQRHAQVLRLGRSGKQQRQQARGGIGFAGARATGDDGQPGAQGQGAGQLLPVHGVGGFHAPGRISGCAWGQSRGCGRCGSRHGVAWAGRIKQPVQPVAGQGLVHRGGVRCPLHHGLRQLLLLQPVAAQVQQGRSGGARQHQRLALVGGVWGVGGVGPACIGSRRPVLPIHHPYQAACAQCRQPLRQRGGHQLPDLLHAGQCGRRPIQHGAGLRRVHHGCQVQTGMAAPFHVRQQGRADQ